MKVLLRFEIVLALILAAAYRVRPDSLAALTILPAWAWVSLAAPGLFALRRNHRILSASFATVWMFFLGLHVEEIPSAARGWLSPISEAKPPQTLRLATLNCGGGQPAALAELAPFAPDVIFLQEPPPRPVVEAFLRDIHGAEGHLLYDLDTAILVRGTLENARPGRSPILYSHAIADLAGIGKIHLVSLRLPTGHVRIDLWNPSCWEIHARHRRNQLDQLRQIAAELPESAPLLVAGDFNAPQGDKLFSLLPARLRDTFAVAGKGIGNTIPNEFPVLRIDQIWVSPDFETRQSFAWKSRASDHRLVVSDLRARSNRGYSSVPRPEPGPAYGSSTSGKLGSASTAGGLPTPASSRKPAAAATIAALSVQ